jgi:hypothetical protein
MRDLSRPVQLPDGRVVESKEKYELYYECVRDALKCGYQPNIKCLVPGDGIRVAG